MGVISPVVGYDIIDSKSWTPSWLFRSYVANARYAFFMDLNVSSLNSQLEWSEVSTLDVILSSFFIIISGCYEIQTYFMSLLFGICIITLWTATGTFTELIQCVKTKDCKNTSEIVLRLFSELKDFSNTINNVWDLFCFWYIIDITPFLATDLDFGLRAHDWFAAIKMFRSVFFFGYNISLSGETFRKMQWFTSWLLERKNRDVFADNMSELKLLLYELRSGPVGIGTPGFYQVNYSFGAQVSRIYFGVYYNIYVGEVNILLFV
ncbi:unnamed protein product [Orchesella dallaii]|uniref:Uncharacterized protein n=1 Tax=Orchesella dallaii TaxID=48710 RepID=A0ABP1Q5B5_9HEXA